MLIIYYFNIVIISFFHKCFPRTWLHHIPSFLLRDLTSPYFRMEFFLWSLRLFFAPGKYLSWRLSGGSVTFGSKILLPRSFQPTETILAPNLHHCGFLGSGRTTNFFGGKLYENSLQASRGNLESGGFSCGVGRVYEVILLFYHFIILSFYFFIILSFYLFIFH